MSRLLPCPEPRSLSLAQHLRSVFPALHTASASAKPATEPLATTTKNRNTSRLAVWGAIFGAAVSAFTPAFAQTTPTPGVSLHFVANEGIVVSGPEGRVMIDAAFTGDYGIFQKPDAATLEKIESAQPPFDHLTAVLASHGDADHIDAATVASHLKHAPQTVFFAPQETVDLFKPLPGFPSLQNRLHALAPEAPVTRFSAGALAVEAVALRHLPRPQGMAPKLPANVGYLFTVGGITFFHTGDTDGRNLETLQQAGLSTAHIDVLLINWLAFEPDEGRAAVAMIQYLHPKIVLLAHLTRKGAPEETARVLKLDGVPPVIPLNALDRTYSLTRTTSGVEMK